MANTATSRRRLPFVETYCPDLIMDHGWFQSYVSDLAISDVGG